LIAALLPERTATVNRQKEKRRRAIEQQQNDANKRDPPGEFHFDVASQRIMPAKNRHEEARALPKLTRNQIGAPFISHEVLLECDASAHRFSREVSFS
jgi:hypothetical protein